MCSIGNVQWCTVLVKSSRVLFSNGIVAFSDAMCSVGNVQSCKVRVMDKDNTL